jgi:hypothetical protein
MLSVQLLLHGEGTNGGTVFTDSSRYARSLTASGNAQTSTTQFKYGSASLRFDGAGDRLSVSNAAFALGTADFTIEMWLWPVTGGGGGTFARLILIGADAVNGSLFLVRSGTTNPAKLALVRYESGAYTDIIAAPAGTLANDTWHHVALTRSGSTWTLWLDGASYGTGTSTFNVTQSTLYIAGNNANNNNFNCYMDELRITTGVARYTASFTAPTEAFSDNWEATDALTDGSALSELMYAGALNEDDVTEIVAVEPQSNLGYTADLTDLLQVAYALADFRAFVLSDAFRSTDLLKDTIGAVATDTASTSDTLTFDYGQILREALALADPLGVSAKYKQSVIDATRLADAIRAGVPQALIDGVGVAHLVNAAVGAVVLDRLRLQELLAPKTTYGVAQLDGVRMGDALRRFVGGELTQAFSIQDTLTPLYYINRTLSDGLALADVIAPQLLFRVLATDALSLDDVEILNAVFSGQLEDAVQISAAYVAPDGSVTTWAINTKTGAVTEYSNYEFNSFARSGFKYLAASPSGLYELDGADDAGTSIVSVIQSGLAQFGGSRFSSFKAAYLGMRGGGDVYLKLETGNGVSYTYKITTEDMRTTKVNLGKGLRARYFSFQLTSTGQDFDLESIEFVPITAVRRV